MFKKRHELIHGSPRHLAFEDEPFDKRELLKFIHYALQYIKQMDAALRKFVPQLAERSTRDINVNQRQRLANSEAEVEKLAKAIERRIASDPDHLQEFRKTQRAWRLWRDRESLFQSADWRGGLAVPLLFWDIAHHSTSSVCGRSKPTFANWKIRRLCAFDLHAIKD